MPPTPSLTAVSHITHVTGVRLMRRYGLQPSIAAALAIALDVEAWVTPGAATRSPNARRSSSNSMRPRGMSVAKE